MARSNMMVDPYDMVPPKDGEIWMNDRGTVIMSRNTLIKVSEGKIPLKSNRRVDLDEKQEIITFMPYLFWRNFRRGLLPRMWAETSSEKSADM